MAMNSSNLASLSLFSGIGGFDLGFEVAGIKTVAMCEANESASSILKKHWPTIPVFDDVRNLHGSDFRAIDLIHGGFPCQDISMAGKREGLAGKKSGLWWEFHRIVSESRPRFVVIENVAGLLSSGGRRDLGAIIGSLAELGYMGGYRVLDSRYFGVAQRRRRVFIVASLGTDCGQKVLFESVSLPGDFKKSRKESKEIPSTSVSSAEKTVLDQQAYSITPKTGGGNQLRAQETDQANSLTAIGQHHDRGTKIVEEFGVRRLTPLECERLMGFPDNWTLIDNQGHIVPDTTRYKVCGNSVVVNVSKWLGQQITSTY